MSTAHWQVQQGGALQGSLVVPGDKSISHRSLMLGADFARELQIAGEKLSPMTAEDKANPDVKNDFLFINEAGLMARRVPSRFSALLLLAAIVRHATAWR